MTPDEFAAECDRRAAEAKSFAVGYQGAGRAARYMDAAFFSELAAYIRSTVSPWTVAMPTEAGDWYFWRLYPGTEMVAVRLFVNSRGELAVSEGDDCCLLSQWVGGQWSKIFRPPSDQKGPTP